MRLENWFFEQCLHTGILASCVKFTKNSQGDTSRDNLIAYECAYQLMKNVESFLPLISLRKSEFLSSRLIIYYFSLRSITKPSTVFFIMHSKNFSIVYCLEEQFVSFFT